MVIRNTETSILLPTWLQMHQPDSISTWLSENTPAKASLGTPLCHLVDKFKPDFAFKDRHRYHLVRTAAGTVALHRHDDLIGCVRTASFKSSQPSSSPRFLWKNEVDVEAVRHWLTTCITSHFNCRFRGSRDLPRSMKVIDCMDACVVPWEPGMKFAALSYTWGSDTGPTLAEGETLPAALPRTVDDAIQLIKRLGLPDLRYLWVDRYCIDQHRLDEKHDQIQQMHKIFSNADLTIIAAHGNNVDSGLPGIGATPRAPQSFIATADGALVFVEANMKSITQSPWMTRGWTFQEACFSRRRLFFTSEQVMFECADITAQEVLRIPLRHGAGCTLKPLFGVHLSNVMGEQRRPFPYYVEEYSRRVLRYDSDALNAFSGILHALEQCEPRLHHHWAIQINNGRCMSLLWDLQHDFDMSQRRWDYPSWSWLGWKGPVTFSRLKVDTAPDVAIWVERLDGILRPIASMSDAEHVTQNPGEYSRYIHIEACAFDVKVCLLGDVVALERETSDGTRNRAVIQRGNSSLLKSQLVGESLQAILLNRHELSDGIRNVATLLLVKQNKNGTASSRVGVCEVKWYPFGYFAEKSGRVKMTRLG